MTTTDLLAECHAILTGCTCNTARCDVCRVRRLIASHDPTIAPDHATLHSWYGKRIDLRAKGGAV